MSKVNLIFYNFDNNVPLIAELVRFYQGREEFEVEVINTAAEVNQFLMTSEQGILFFQVKTKKDLQDGVAVLKTNKKGIKKGLIKPACISTITNRKVETLLAKYGCQDILDPQTKAKTLTFKLDFWSKPIKKLLQKMQKEEQLLMQKADAKNAENNNASEKQDFEMTKSLELQSDFWLVKAKADYKRILKRYLIRLLGPSPYIGTWIELDPQPGDKQPTWKWVLKDPDNEDYVVDDGAWFFYGAKPEFDWKIKRWSFASDAPHLYFYARSGEVFSKFKFQDGVVRIAENSEFANLREEMILETCDSKFNFEGEGIQDEDSKNLEGDGDGADNIGGTLSGDADNEASAGTLSGKGSAADRFGDDPVSGKGGAVDELGNPIEGKGSAADRYGDDPLSGKGGAVDELGNPIEGKGSAADRYGDEPLSGKAATDALGNPIDGKGAPADRYGDNPLGGKGSAADHYGDDPLSGKAATDAMGNPVDGKGSPADRYGDNPLGGKGSRADHYGDRPLEGRLDQQPKPGQLDPKAVKLDPASLKQAIDKAGDQLDPALKEKLENAQSLDDLIPNADKLSADELKAALDELGLPDGLLDELDLAKPLAELNEQKLALEQLDASLADLIKNAQSLDDLIPNLDELSAAELEEAKKKLGIDDDILDKLNLGQPILKHMKKKQALEKLTPAVQALAKEATSLNDLIPDADKLSPAELAEAKKRLGIDDDILDALDLGNPILNPRRMTMADAKDVVIDNALRDEKKKEDSDDLDDYFNEKKRERERLQELAEKNGSEDYLAKERERKRALAEKAEAEGQEIGDYYNEKKRRAEEVRKREEELEKEYASREASKKDSLNQHSVDHGDRTIDGKPTAAQKEQELFDALGGGLTDGATSDFSGQMIGSAREEEVNLESGDLQVVISQKLGANNEVNMICEFEDFYSEELVVKVPKGSFAFGVDTEVGATVTLTYNGQKIEVKSKGKVVEVEALNESKETLIIELFEIDAKKYETFITLYEDRQQSIMDFMKLAKGY